MKLIVGLGNPGKKYKDNRHNVGYMAIEKISALNNIILNKTKFHSLVGSGKIGNEKVILLKPVTYMNDSGIAVAEAMNYYGINIKDVIIICDDIDIPFGSIRIKQKGSAGTHNGLKSIVACTKSTDFPRVKISVGKKPQQMDLADFVLSNFSNDEIVTLREEIDDAVCATELIINGKIDEAMNKYNGLHHSI